MKNGIMEPGGWVCGGGKGQSSKKSVNTEMAEVN